MSGTPRILCVDDNPRNLTILKKSLGPGHEIETATSGEEAIAIATRTTPDVVLLDIMMPGIDGYETCRRMRALPSLAGTKIILVSAKALTSERLQGYAVGADDFVVKPFEPDELLAKVRVYLRLKRVEEFEHLKGDLLVLLSHEVRTPLTSIVGPLDMLLLDPRFDDNQRELLDLMAAASRRLTLLADRVSYLVGMRTGATPMTQLALPLGERAAAAALRFGEEAGKGGITIAVEGEVEAAVMMDPEHLDRAIDALMQNALRYSPRGGVVRLTVGTTGEHARLEVSDDGPGVAPAIAPRVLQAFTVGDLDHHQDGLGLGLATARAIVDRLGGRLFLDPEGRGKGATFVMEFPLSRTPVVSVGA